MHHNLLKFEKVMSSNLEATPQDQNVSTEDLDENLVPMLWSTTLLRSEKELN